MLRVQAMTRITAIPAVMEIYFQRFIIKKRADYQIIKTLKNVEIKLKQNRRQ